MNPPRLLALILATGLAALAILLHHPGQDLVAAPSARITGAAYQPWKDSRGPEGGPEPSRDDVRADLLALRDQIGTSMLRTYSALGASGQVPALATEHGMTVLQGVWIGRSAEARRAEIEAAVALASEPSIRGFIVGSEAILRSDATQEELMTFAREVRARTGKPVGIAELWKTWTERPGMADAVDFAVIHVLPYWDNVIATRALTQAQNAIAEVRAALPARVRVVVGETGWPSRGSPSWNSQTGLTEQARYIRAYFDWQRTSGIESYVMEAFDGPWKWRIEGSVGPYWGVLDANRNLKFPLSGPIQTAPLWHAEALAAWIGSMLALWTAWHFARCRGLGLIFAALAGFGGGSLLGWIGVSLSTRYWTTMDLFVWTLALGLATVVLLLTALEWLSGAARSEESGLFPGEGVAERPRCEIRFRGDGVDGDPIEAVAQEHIHCRVFDAAPCVCSLAFPEAARAAFVSAFGSARLRLVGSSDRRVRGVPDGSDQQPVLVDLE